MALLGDSPSLSLGLRLIMMHTINPIDTVNTITLLMHTINPISRNPIPIPIPIQNPLSLLFPLIRLSIKTTPRPIIRQRPRIQNRLSLHVLAHGDIDIIQFNPLVPISPKMTNNLNSQPGRSRNNAISLRILATE